MVQRFSVVQRKFEEWKEGTGGRGAQSKLGVSIEAKKGNIPASHKGRKRKKAMLDFSEYSENSPSARSRGQGSQAWAVKIHVPSRDCLPLGSSEWPNSSFSAKILKCLSESGHTLFLFFGSFPQVSHTGLFYTCDCHTLRPQTLNTTQKHEVSVPR